MCCSGSVIGQALTDHNDVRKVGFTGSTEVGKTIMKWLVQYYITLHPFKPAFFLSCAVSNAKRVSLELGGKSPLIIFGDCDMDKAVRQVIMHALSSWFLVMCAVFSVTGSCVLQQRRELHCCRESVCRALHTR